MILTELAREILKHRMAQVRVIARMFGLARCYCINQKKHGLFPAVAHLKVAYK